MPLIDRIPLPGLPMEEFRKSAASSQNIINSMLNNQINRENLGIQQQGAQQRNQLFPYLLQKAAQEQQEREMKLNAQRQFYGDLVGGNPSSIAQSNNSNPNLRGGNEIQRNPSNANLPRQQLVNLANQDQIRSDQQEGINNPYLNPASMNDNANQQPRLQQAEMQNGQLNLNSNQQQQQAQIQPQQQRFREIQNRLQNGEEVTVKPPIFPEKEKWDRYAGQKMFGIQIEPIKSRVVDGIRYDTFPSGKIVAQKEGPSAEEKEATRLSVAESKIEAQANRKEGAKIEEAAMPLAKTAEVAMEAKKILARNKGLTGLHNYLGLKTRLSKNKDLNRLKFLFGKLQAEIGRYASSRGGIQAIKWAGSVKPDILNNQDANEAMIDQALENSKADFDRENFRYKSKLKKDLPIKFPKGTTTLYRDGHTYEIPEEKVEGALAKGFSRGR